MKPRSIMPLNTHIPKIPYMTTIKNTTSPFYDGDTILSLNNTVGFPEPPFYVVITYPTNPLLMSTDISNYEVLMVGSVSSTSLGNLTRSKFSLDPNWNYPTGSHVAAIYTAEHHHDMARGIMSLHGFKNMVMNGGFDVWQRTENTGTLTYPVRGPDRWTTDISGPITARTYLQTGAAVINNDNFDGRRPHKVCRIFLGNSANATNSSYIRFLHYIEGSHWGESNFLTLSFWLRSYSSRQITISVVRKANDDTNPETIHSEKISISTGWHKYITSFFIPNLSSTNVHQDQESFIYIGFWLSAGSNLNMFSNSLGIQPNGSVIFSNIQLEEGTVATPFEQRSYMTEFNMCQRYFYKGYAESIEPGTPNQVIGILDWSAWGNGANECLHPVRFPTPMRKTPTIKIYAYDGTEGFILNGTAGMTNIAGEAERTGHYGTYIKPVNNADVSPNNQLYCFVTADADY